MVNLSKFTSKVTTNFVTKICHSNPTDSSSYFQGTCAKLKYPLSSSLTYQIIE